LVAISRRLNQLHWLVWAARIIDSRSQIWPGSCSLVGVPHHVHELFGHLGRHLVARRGAKLLAISCTKRRGRMPIRSVRSTIARHRPDLRRHVADVSAAGLWRPDFLSILVRPRKLRGRPRFASASGRSRGRAVFFDRRMVAAADHQRDPAGQIGFHHHVSGIDRKGQKQARSMVPVLMPS